MNGGLRRTGLGPFPLPGEKRREARAEQRAREVLAALAEVEARQAESAEPEPDR